MKQKVLLGMSGGVDSSVAAMMLQESGFEVVGVTFLFGGNEDKLLNSVEEARFLACNLGINHISADVRDDFKQVVENYFIEEYKQGKTPFPCAVCNPEIKFRYLNLLATENNCDFISTGHYARVNKFNEKYFVFQGIDTDKDQSFFLWGLQNEIVQKLILPLGNSTKFEIREYANQRGFTTLSKRKDSLGVCFIQGDDYRKYLIDNGLNYATGHFVNKEGKILGRHNGIFNYTIGQRRGLGIQLNKLLFVAEIRHDKNEILLEEYESLYKNKIRINRYYFTDIQEIKLDIVFIVRVRYRLQNTPCKVKIIDKNVADVILHEPLAMIANGQTAVFYDNDRVVGGGFIMKLFKVYAIK
jgi:tRNA-specific 2-thiouridylase